MRNKNFWVSYAIPVLLVLIMVCAVAVYYRSVREESNKRALKTLQAAVETQALSLAMTLEGEYEVMEAMASSVAAVSGGNFSKIVPLLDEMLPDSEYWSFGIAEATGSGWYSSGAAFEIDKRKYFQDSMIGRRAIMLINETNIEAEQRIVMSVPIRTGERIHGVLFGTTRADHFRYGLESKSFDGKGVYYITNGSGQVIVGNSTSLVNAGENIVDAASECRFEYGSYEGIKKDMAKGESGIASYELSGAMYLCVYQAIGINNWMMIAVLPSDVIDGMASDAAMGGLLLAGTVVVVAVLLDAIVIMQAKKSRKHGEFSQHLYNTMPCGVIQFTFEEEPKITNCNETCARMFGYSGENPFIGQGVRGITTPDDAVAFRREFRKCAQTQSPVNFTFPIVRMNASLVYADCTLELIALPNGTKIYQAVFLDVTEREKKRLKLRAQYMQELRRHASRTDTLLFTTCMNLTQDTLVSSDLPEAQSAIGKTLNEIFDEVIRELAKVEGEEWLADYKRQVSREILLKDYEIGKSEFRIKHRHQIDGKLIRVVTEYNIRMNPTTGDILVFLYTWDINDSEIVSIVTRSIAVADYEYFLQIDCNSRTYKRYSLSVKEETFPKEGDYSEVAGFKRLSGLMEADAARQLEEDISIECVRDQLRHVKRFTVYTSMRGEGGRRIDKALTFFYIDERNGLLAMTVSDVTAVRREEVERAAQIKDALSAAEVASNAKGAFLSQMSHEIRTPLNAVIGYLTLAKESGSDTAALMDCVEKSAIASKHLLSISNDVLDMSSIESGRLKIAHEEFDFKYLITALTTVYYTQAAEKGVAFEVQVDPLTSEWLVGDAMRVNQVLMNLLSNAMKFTDRGGKITLYVQELGIIKETVQMRMTVSDTGCGMSNEFMSRLFTPFEQQDATVARRHGGSGLGLSITKNLVNMMGGKIEVSSELGVGSAFSVNLAFGRSERTADGKSGYDFSRLRALVADDVEHDRDYVKNILKHCGVKCDVVNSGKAAVQQIERRLSSSHPYDFCLVDWNMPDIDGIEAARRIRKIAGDKLPIICITAYDTAPLISDAQVAGANAVMPKPLFQSTMFNLLVNTFGGVVKPVLTEPLNVEDVRGVHILLAEDNAMNVDIATRYLKKLGITVTTAWTGKEALDKFTQSPALTFDAILMDIQMPEMDGYQAARAIRQSGHPEAQSVPIIAMTANAFAEDVTAAVAAGMNDHVAKPIDYAKLCAALDKYAKPRMRERVRTEQPSDVKESLNG